MNFDKPAPELFYGAPIYNTEARVFKGTSSEINPFKFVKYSDLSKNPEINIHDLRRMETYIETFLITNLDKHVQPYDVQFRSLEWDFCNSEVFLISSKPMIVFEYSCVIDNDYYSDHKESFKLGILLDNNVATVPKTRHITGLQDYEYNFTLSRISDVLHQITFEVSENKNAKCLKVLSRVLPGGDLTAYRAVGDLDYLQATIDNIKTVHEEMFSR